MNKTLRTILFILAGLAVAAGIFFAGTWLGRRVGYDRSPILTMRNFRKEQVPFSTWEWENRGFMPGKSNSPMMPGMWGGNRMHPGMMGGYRYQPPAPSPLTIEQAKAAAEKYLDKLDVTDLEITEIMIFDNNAYVVVEESSSGIGAFELLVDPYTQVAFPEPGPNMMWNLKYGAINHCYGMGGHGGMMGRSGVGVCDFNGSETSPADVSIEMTVTPEQASEAAQGYLDANFNGAVASDHLTQFYGYYTLDYEIDGEVAGMLSIHGTTGQTFPHHWHGSFIEESATE